MSDAAALALAVEAAACWGGCDAPRLIKNRENAVFEVTLPQGRVALRLHRVGYQTEAAIRSELWWQRSLAAAGVAVPEPVATRGGEWLVRLQGGRIASVIRWVEGEAIGAGDVPFVQDVAWQTDTYRTLGRLLAQVHAYADRLVRPPEFDRPDWGQRGLLGEAPFWGRFWEHPGLSRDQAAMLLAARDFARIRLDEFSDGDQGLIHADVLRENVLERDGALTLIDFDDCGFGYRLYDLGTALSQNLHEPHLGAIATALVEGYAAQRPLTHHDRTMLPLFVLLRSLVSVGWTMPRLSPDDPGAKRHMDRAIRAAGIVMGGGNLLA